ncbi:MAG: Hfq-like protein [Thermoanaerobaculia bacterium]
MPHPTRSRLFEANHRGGGRATTIADFRAEKRARGRNNNGGPPAETHAETFYYLKQMSSRTPMVVRLVDGEEIRGWIEWYDRECLKINRRGAPNLLVPKHSIKYLYKQSDE